MAATCGCIIVENQVLYEALQLHLALHERAVWCERFGDLPPVSLDLMSRLSITYGTAIAEQIASVLRAEREVGRKSLAEECATFIDETMLG